MSLKVPRKRRRSIGHFLTWDNDVVEEAEATEIATQIATLNQEQKKCLEICSFLGLHFPYDAVKGVAPGSLSRKDKGTGLPMIDTVLNGLVEKNILTCDGVPNFAGDVDSEIESLTRTISSSLAEASKEYSFRNSKFAVLTYKSMSPSKRLFQHKKVALWIEGRYTDDLRTHFAPLTYHFMRAEVWEKAIKYMKLTIQTAVLAGAMLEATVVVDHALLNDTLPCSALEALEAQIRDCRATCERAAEEEDKACTSDDEGGDGFQTSGGTAVGGMKESWFDLSQTKEETLTSLVQGQIKYMKGLLLGNDSEGNKENVDDDGVETISLTPSMKVKAQILAAAEMRVRTKLLEKRKEEGEPQATAPPPSPPQTTPEKESGSSEKKGGGMFGRLFKKRKVAPES